MFARRVSGLLSSGTSGSSALLCGHDTSSSHRQGAVYCDTAHRLGHIGHYCTSTRLPHGARSGVIQWGIGHKEATPRVGGIGDILEELAERDGRLA